MKTLLQYLGLRSNCCNAKIIAWHSDKFYCEHCEHWLGASVSSVSPSTFDTPQILHQSIRS